VGTWKGGGRGTGKANGMVGVYLRYRECRSWGFDTTSRAVLRGKEERDEEFTNASRG
jgi:hypothetical protein